MSDTGRLDLIGAGEAAAILGIRPTNFLRDWASRPDFPRPVVDLRRRRLWDRQAVLAYRRSVGRRRGEPLRKVATSDDVARQLRTIKRRIVRGFEPDQIILFGSRARGDARPDSDLDLLVVVGDDRDRSVLALEIRQSLADIGIAKDVLVTTPSEIARYGDVIGSVLEPALREGVTIYARS